MNVAGERLPVVVLISGRGSNLRSIASEARTEALPVDIRAVVSDRADAAGLEWARSVGLHCATLSPKEFPDRMRYDEALAALVASFAPGLVVLAGFMRILGPAFVDCFAGRMLNIHPSLLPSFPGLHTHRRALEAGVKIHGCTVHFVTPTLDHGPIVAQAAVPVRPDDDEDALAARVLEQEHLIYPRAIRWFVEERLVIENGVVRVLGSKGEQFVMACR